jgi:hypothetical protein
VNERKGKENKDTRKRDRQTDTHTEREERRNVYLTKRGVKERK